MSDTGQLSLTPQPDSLGGWFGRCLHALKSGKVSCMTLYAMHLASGVPVVMEPGVCPVCGSHQCKLARALAQRH
ncbi:MAG TPA: hypothetical protein VFB39_07325 [Solirubrobacteraceae bacterium]|jgi:hypothetical protein|nr:hypothetical protein [Solirubrobacteraceae bacterium]